jgi:hypothetical protein
MCFLVSSSHQPFGLSGGDVIEQGCLTVNKAAGKEDRASREPEFDTIYAAEVGKAFGRVEKWQVKPKSQMNVAKCFSW